MEGIVHLVVMVTVCHVTWGAEEFSLTKRSAEVSHDLSIPFRSLSARSLSGGQEVLQRVKRKDELEQELKLDDTLERMKRVKKSMESRLETELRSLGRRRKRFASSSDEEDDDDDNDEVTLSRTKRTRRSLTRNGLMSRQWSKRSLRKALERAKRLKDQVRRLKRQARTPSRKHQKHLKHADSDESGPHFSNKQKALENLRNKLHDARVAMHRYEKKFGRLGNENKFTNPRQNERARNHRRNRLALQRHLNLPRPNHPNAHAGRIGHVPYDKKSSKVQDKEDQAIAKEQSEGRQLRSQKAKH